MNQNPRTTPWHTVHTPKRIELKDLLSVRDFPTIEAALRTSTLGFHSPFPQRQINSLYFDSYDFRTIEQSLSGSSLRKKHRFRWYGATENAHHPTLESKCKQGHLSWKILRRTQITFDLKALTWETAYKNNGSETNFSDLCKILPISTTRPTSLVSYLRNYFESADGRLRVTLDKNLTFRDQNAYSRPNLKHTRFHPEKLVLEIKFAEEDSDLLRVLANHISFVPRRFSKYCESLQGHLPRWI